MTFLLLYSLTWASTNGFRKNTASSLVIAAPACSVLRPLTLTSVRRTKTFPFDPTGTWILSWVGPRVMIRLSTSPGPIR